MKKILFSILLVGSVIIFPSIIHAATPVYDDFIGSIVSASKWHIPTWVSPIDGTFVGRTQFRCSQNSPLPAANSSNAIIAVQTYNPTGFSFYGTDLISDQSFALGQGVNITVRAKMNTSAPGIVGGIFLYALKPGSTTLHDEIDFELLTNQPNQVQTNIYSNEPLGAGNPQFTSYASGAITDYHTYEIKWLPGQVSWLVDGNLVRTETSDIPAGPMNFHLNMWVPDSGWTKAYNGNIQPTRSASSNQVFSMNVDSVNIRPITSEPTLTTINLSPLTANLVVGKTTQQLTAAKLDQQGNPIVATLAWTSSNPSVAKVSATGLVTPVASGTTNITASSNGITSAPAVITVIKPTLTTIILSPLTANLVVGKTTQQLTAAKLDQQGNPIVATLAWTSSNPSVAKVSATGLVTPVASGTTNITASSNGITSAPAVITVIKPTLTTINLSPLTANLVVGKTTQQLTAAKLDQQGNPIAATLAWTSSNPSVAKVSAAGLVTPIASGTTNITASSNGITSAPAVITVIKPTLTTIILSPLTANLVVGKTTQQLTAAKLDQQGNPIVATLAWTSSNPSVAKVSAAGLVTPIASGTTNITASSNGITSAPAVITVPIPSVQITSVPKMGQMGNATGKVVGLLSSNCSKYKVAVFINVVGGWWTKPYWASPLTTIQPNGTWTADITTGGIDQNAVEIRAYLVPSGFDVPLCNGNVSIPPSLDSFPYASVTR